LVDEMTCAERIGKYSRGFKEQIIKDESNAEYKYWIAFDGRIAPTTGYQQDVETKPTKF
jgi:hypothetical protein